MAPTRPDQASAITAEFLATVYPLLRAMNDYVIVDTPPGFTPEVIASIDSSSDICMVGTLDSLSLKNTKLGLETLGADGLRPRPDPPRAEPRGQPRGHHADDVSDDRRPRARRARAEPRATSPRSVNEGGRSCTAQPRSEAAKAFKALARDLYEQVHGAPGADQNGRRFADRKR